MKMENRKKKHWKTGKAAVVCLAAALCGVWLLAGCGRSDLPFHKAKSSGSSIFEVGGEKCPAAEGKIILMNYQKEYSSLYGMDLWSADTAARVKLEEYVRNITLSRLAEVYTLDIIAQKRELSLSGSDKGKAEQAAKEYYQGLTQEEKDYIGADEADVERLFERYLLAGKLFEDVTSDVNREVSDNEACVMEVQQVKITQKEDADEIYAKLRDGADLYSLPSAYKDVDVEDRTITRTTFGPDYEENLFSMETGQYSGIIRMEDGYYIFYCVNAFNPELTDKNKENVLSQRLQDALEDVYLSYADHLSSSVNEKEWDEIAADPQLSLSGPSFMEVYRSYFGSFE